MLNSPLRFIDVSGFWGVGVHSSKTSEWAQSADAGSYTKVAAERIGLANNATDVLPGANPLPYLGDQSYHFNRAAVGQEDTRMVKVREHVESAKMMCSLRPRLVTLAAIDLGRALHALQDYYAHGDYAIKEHPNILTFHNEHSEQPGAPATLAG